jgi:DeoR family transcriptional regulator of aga operon
MNGDIEATASPATHRRTGVLEVLRRTGFASVADLSSQFGVSEVTIRSDLDALAEEGQIRRVRGGAIHRATANLEAPFEQAQTTFAAEKRAIATAAAALVESGQTVLLDAGSTAAAVACALVARSELHDLTVFTNGLRVALELEPALPAFTVMVSGGALRRQQHSLVNPFGMTIWEQIHGHVAFLDCQGIEAQAGVTHINVAEAEIKRAILASARMRIVVADGSKVGQVSLVHVVPITDVNLLITDVSADAGALAALRERGVEVQVVDLQRGDRE